MPDWLNWLVFSTPGLILRIGLGVAFFLTMAIVDLARHGQDSRRWREYLFLLAGVGVAMIYSIANDQVTVSISPGYFLFGKGAAQQLPAEYTQADLRLKALQVGIMATWWMGLVAAALLLVANSYPKRWPTLPIRRLLTLLPIVLGVTILFAALGAMAAHLGWLEPISDRQTWESFDAIGDPDAFFLVWGIHLGGYVGAAVGALTAIAIVLSGRRGLAKSNNPAQPS